MNYQPHLIAKYETGFDQELQPWLLPEDAQFQLFDGFVYRGVWQKRQGYSQFATGQRGGSTYRESRMIHTTTGASMTGVINSSNTVFTATLTTPVVRGSVTVTGTMPPQSYTDNGLGVFATAGAGSTIDYATGALSINLLAAPTGGTVKVTYSTHQGFPVMGVMNYYTQLNTRELIVADTTYVNRFNPITNVLVDISPTTLLTGDKTNFMSWTNYPDPNALKRLLFVNNKDPIQQYNGTTVTPYPVFTDSTQITAAPSGVLGNGTAGPYLINTPANTGIVPGTLTINEPTTPQTVTDNGFGLLTGQGSGTVNYLSGAISVTFTSPVGIGNAINLTYKQMNTPIDTCLHIRVFKDRLLLLSTTESGTRFSLRIRVSGTGQFGDVFTTEAIGAGVIDIPDQTFIQASDFSRDDLLIFTESSTWIVKYTSSDVVPFALEKLDESRGSQAPYGTISYLNKTSAASTRGLILTDGYSVVRSDDRIPFFTVNNIDQENFAQCFAGAVDVDRDHYLIYPSTGNSSSDSILVTNYEEENLAVYNIPLSCMGDFIGAFDVTWNDLIIYDNWDDLAGVYGNWNSFSFSQGAPFSIGGGNEGEIFRLNVTELQDFPVRIYNITIVDPMTLQVTTDFQNYQLGDIINLETIRGMFEANDKQGAITSVISNYVFNMEIDTEGFSTYTDSGVASKVIVFDSITKKFNPFAEQNQKVRCGWVYLYVSTTGTNLTDNQFIVGASNTNPCVLNIPGHGYTTGIQVYVDSVVGMTQLNGNYFYITVIDQDNFSLDGIDATGYGTYVSNGFASTPSDAILQIRVIVNDTEQSTQVNNFNPAPYQVNLSSQEAQNGIKKWYKLWINQTGRFIQFEFINAQAGAKVEIHAVMPGFMGVGRLI